MKWTASPMAAADARAIQAWCYAPPLDVYNNMDEEELLNGEYYAARLDGALAGYFCLGKSAQVHGARAIYTAHPQDVDLGLGLAPDWVGQGLGLSLVEHALACMGVGRAARLAVYTWNERARKIYARAGFEPVAFAGDFLIMRRPAWDWQEASRPLVSGMETYPGDPAFARKQFLFAKDFGYDATLLSITAHTGTHLDGPSHVALAGGVDHWPLHRLNSTVQLLDVSDGDGPIQAREIQGLRARRVLLRTRQAADAPERGLASEAAEFLISRGLELLGTDGLSVGPKGPMGLTVHRALLGADIALVENLALERFEPGWYAMRCMALHLPDCDGAPARAFLRRISWATE